MPSGINERSAKASKTISQMRNGRADIDPSHIGQALEQSGALRCGNLQMDKRLKTGKRCFADRFALTFGLGDESLGDLLRRATADGLNARKLHHLFTTRCASSGVAAAMAAISALIFAFDRLGDLSKRGFKTRSRAKRTFAAAGARERKAQTIEEG